MNCEICGRHETHYNALIEGTQLAVCEDCSKFGKIISKAAQEKSLQKKPALVKKKDEVVEIIIDDYGNTIKKAREKLALSQEDFAKKINEKASLVHKLETFGIEPSIELAKKIEKFLKVKLVMQYEEIKEIPTAKNDEKITVGDMLNIKK